MHHLEVLGAAEVVVARADQKHEVALVTESSVKALGVVVDLADHADDWRGIDAGSARGLVVEADIAAHDRDLQRAAGLGQAGDRLLHLPVHLWPVGIGEVQAVGHGQRLRPGRDDVARSFRNRQLSPEVRVELAVAGVARGGDSQTNAPRRRTRPSPSPRPGQAP